MSILKGLIAVTATKMSKEALPVGIAATAEIAKGIAKKTGILRENRYGELVLKVPFFKTTEAKIEKAFEKHPERNKVCFHFVESIRNGVVFYNPEGKETFEIRRSKKNLKQIDLYERGKCVGSIKKHITININPFADVQKYDAVVHGKTGIIKLNWFDVSADFVSLKLKHKRLGNYIVENSKEEEIGRVYSLGYFNFVIDYETTADPVAIILAFMAIKIRLEEVKRNHHRGYKGRLWIDEVIADIKDVF